MKKYLIITALLLASNILSAQWTSFGTPNWDPRSMFADNDENVLYVGGGFGFINGQEIRGIGKWDGAAWHDLDLGMDTANYPNGVNNVLAITKYKGEIIAAGSFSTAGGAESKYIARWDGTAWHSFNGQPNNTVEDLLVYNDQLYIAGGFDSLGSIKANGVGMWDGTEWYSVGDFPEYYPNPFDHNVIYAITSFQGNIYISGQFLDSTSSYTRYLAWFDGLKWNYFQDDLKGALAGGWTMQVYDNELYVAGYFLKQDGNYDNCIQRWNGTSWNSVGGGTKGPNETIWKLKVWNGKLYAVGTFAEAGGIPASKVATWDGVKWCSTGSNFDGDVVALEFYKDTLHVAGGFKIIDGDSAIYLAKWLGSDYADTCSVSVGISESNQDSFDFSVFPNPASDEFTLTTSENGLLTIKNELGQILQSFTVHNKQLKISTSKFPSGNYFLTFQTSKNAQTKKLLIQH